MSAPIRSSRSHGYSATTNVSTVWPHGRRWLLHRSTASSSVRPRGLGLQGRSPPELATLLYGGGDYYNTAMAMQQLWSQIKSFELKDGHCFGQGGVPKHPCFGNVFDVGGLQHFQCFNEPNLRPVTNIMIPFRQLFGQLGFNKLGPNLCRFVLRCFNQ